MKARSPIIVVHIASGDLWAGAEAQLFTLVKTLHISENISVRVILLNHGELENRLNDRGIPVEVFDESQLNGFQILWRIIKLLNSWQPHVVHTHRTKENILGGISARLAGNIPSLRTVHGAPEHPHDWRKPHKWIIYSLDLLVGRFLQRKIIAVSDELAELLSENFPRKKIEVIENGVDIEALAPYAKNPDDIDKLPAIINIGLAGRLVPVKRVDIFIRAAQYFCEHYSNINIQFHIFGNGPLYYELKDTSEKLGLDKVIIFEGHCENIHQRIKALDILVMTSEHEGLPMILLEAMSLQIPIIAHSVGGIPKLLEYGSAGILVDDHSELGYSNEIYRLIMNSKMRLDIIRNAFEQVKNNYSATKNANNFCNEYYKLAKYRP